MRIAYYNFGSVMIDEQYIGISLGYDYCAEHEWGIKKIQLAFGIPECSRETVGIACRKITKSPMDDIQFKYSGKHTYLTFVSNASKYSNVKYCDDVTDKSAFSKISRSIKTEILTSWSDGAFSILGYGKVARKRLKELYENFKKNNIVITYFSSGNPFSGNSLCLLIADKIPEKHLEQIKFEDIKSLDLADITKKLDLKGKAKKNGMDYNHFNSISHDFIQYGATKKELAAAKKAKGIKTKYDTIVWVNGSREQGYGWFTVEDVIDWISHKGKKPISDWKKII